jgi:DNA invertase Pin-like site-specific DNA recombinase
MQRYVCYFRVSTKEQGRSGLGLEAQARDVQLFLEGFSEIPWEVIGTFTDIQSGTEDDRPELAKALALVRKTGATLLVAKLDRLSRKMSFIAPLMDDPKVQMRVASMPYADKFQLHIYAALAEQERTFISARTKAALGQAKARGVKLGGIRPKTEARNVAVQELAKANADRVAAIVQPMRAQGASLRAIAGALKEAGVPTARGGEWTAAQVQRTLDRLVGGRPSDN